ncbi:hypothetical protein [Desulfitobacterium chlororespirans]|uniref:Cell cycle protein n=1 Tax=Desulfitobacterium chlororespirans DSM 11544 TaxID=1121395 RepID=A0A1M7SLG6_9FIRM|nr:hypothetical protein [Desulfitobacterium chlororespirans]SHN59321.1 hypothetical protein SAMN02745215_01041 [Desulfitobacterium chlororespirans DSM 11544]
MYQNHVPALVWGQNIICFLAMSFIYWIVVTYKFDFFSGSKHKTIIVPIAMCLLILTFLNPGMEGVHRWISIGIIKLNIAMIVLPIIIIGLGQIVQTKGFGVGSVAAIGTVFVLFFQPDASQLTGFAIPMMILISSETKSKLLRLFIISVFSVCAILSWMHLDSLPPVNHVEGIVSMAADMGTLWLILGIISLAILPIPFLLFPPENAGLISRCIGVYYSIILVSTVPGNFPVPLMGYGLSPIIGYFIAMIWYIKSKHINQVYHLK